MYTKHLGMEDMHMHRHRNALLHGMYERLRQAGETVNDVRGPRDSVMLVGRAQDIAQRAQQQHSAENCAQTTYEGQEVWCAGRSRDYEMRSMRKQCVDLIDAHLHGTNQAMEGDARLAAPITDAHSIWTGYENKVTVIWRTELRVEEDTHTREETYMTTGTACAHDAPAAFLLA